MAAVDPQAIPRRRAPRGPLGLVRTLAHRVIVVAGAAIVTLALFLVLPLMQNLSHPPAGDLTVETVNTTNLPPPPPPPPEKEEEKPREEPKPPELNDAPKPLDLSQLELALNPSFGDGALTGDFAVKLDTVAQSTQSADALFSLSELDQQPRAVYQPSPAITSEIRRRAPGTVYIIFIVDKNGRVENPIVQKSTDPIFEKSALDAVRQWKFEPGKRNGDPVRFRMRVPISFPKG